MDIFYKDTVNAGVMNIVTLPEVKGQAQLFFFTQPSSSGRTFVPNVIITKVDYQQRTNTQFQQSLENVIYVYSFGDLMGDLTVNGVAIPRSCDGDSNGIKEVMQFYKQNRVSNSVSDVRITFADEVIRGYLVGLSLSTLDASSGLHSMTLLLKTMPAAFRSSQGNWAGGGVESVPEGLA